MLNKYFFIGFVLLVFSCTDPAEDPIETTLAGGTTTIFSEGPNAYSFALANLDAAGLQKHLAADKLFSQQFVTAPSSQAGGLGPVFNQNSCVSCHVRNGRGTIVQVPDDPNSGMLLRLSTSGADAFGLPNAIPYFGRQLQTKAIFGVEKEGGIDYDELYETVQFLDGKTTELSHRNYHITSPYVPLPMQYFISPRNATPVFGIGLLEAINVQEILANEDIQDANQDGISGKANRVYDVLKGDLAVGRFGWKAEQPTATQQAADAAHNDMGLTSSYFLDEQCMGQDNCTQGLQQTKDIDDEILELMTYYFQTLAPPAQRTTGSQDVIDGEKIFNELKCNSCHINAFRTSDHPIKELSNQKIHPYTDLLLHDMGDALSDHRKSFLADGNEWRTSPLWGLGLTQIVNPKATFLHDGRAHTIEEAILWHGGESEKSKLEYLRLSEKERSQLLAFLGSL